MSSPHKKIVIVLLALVYLCSASFVEIGHNHFLSGGSQNSSELRSHDCGAKELHKPIGSEKTCVLCQRALQFVTTLASASPAVVTPERPLVSSNLSSYQTLETFLLFYKRGPPVPIS